MKELKIYYADNGERRGPLSLEEIIALGLPPDTLIYYSELGDWTPISEAPATAKLYDIPSAEVVEETVISFSEPPAFQPSVNPPGNMNGSHGNGQVSGQLYGVPVGQCPSSHMVWNIVNLVLFFTFGVFLSWVFAIPGIVYSSKVDKLWRKGRYDEARRASKNAKTFAVISTVIGVVTCVVDILICIFCWALVISIWVAFVAFISNLVNSVGG